MDNNYDFKLLKIKTDKDGNKLYDCENVEKTQWRTLNYDEMLYLIKNFIVKDAELNENGEILYKIKNAIKIDGHRKNFIDLTGQHFYEWEVIKRADNKNGRTYWHCKCSCGIEKDVEAGHLKDGSTKSCGHEIKFIDLKGKQFGEWTVLEYVGNQCWLCRCSCKTEKIVNGQSLRNGSTTSCGHKNVNLIDLAGKQFGEWTVLEYAYRKNCKSYWKCKCSCGKIKLVSSQSLRKGTSTSCGHATTGFVDLTGQQIGDWFVEEYLGYREDHNTYWRCRCTCGVVNEVNGQSLRKGTSTSCGHTVIKDLAGMKFGEWTVISFDHTRRFNASRNNVPYWLCHCSCGTDRVVNGQNLLNGFSTSCGHDTNTSSIEQEVKQFISSLGFSPKKDRTILNGKELDIYLSEQKLAIEFNGSYWHSAQIKSKYYHKEKSLACIQKSIDLIHIFEYEWRNEERRQKIYSLLKNRLNIDQKVVYARNLEIRYVTDKNIERYFLEENHLQGYAVSKTALGLFDDDLLLELMTFGKPRFNTNYSTELIRFCTLQGYKVVGGAEKLFKHYIKSHTTENIISYCDIAKFTGRIYNQLGFKFIGYTEPNYIYANSKGLILSRYQCQKQELIKKGWGTEDETEEQIMFNHGFYKIYDSGNAKYIYTS